MTEAASATLAVYQRAWETMRADYIKKVDEVAELQKRIAQLESEKLAMLELFWQLEGESKSE